MKTIIPKLIDCFKRLVVACAATIPFSIATTSLILLSPTTSFAVVELERVVVNVRREDVQSFLDAAQAAFDAMLLSYVEGQNQLTGSGEQLELPLDRTEPACIQEKLILEGLKAAINYPSVGLGLENPPGRMIIPNENIGDPRFSGAGWEKWQLIAKWGPQGSPPPYTVVIHYMFNTITRQSAQFKFKNTPQQGCRAGGA